MTTRRAVSLVGALSVLAACGGGGDGFVTPTPPPPPAVTVSMSPTSANVNVGSTTSFAVSIAGGSPTPTLASCSSSSSATATVAQSGNSCVATGVSPGTATITATTSGAQTATAQVTVVAPPPALTAFTLTPATGSLGVGETLPLTATPSSPQGATVTVSYVSSAGTVASVSAAGVVTAVAPGTATITATAAGTGPGMTATTIQRTSTITVTSNACAPIAVTLPAARNGTVTSTSCLFNTTLPQRGDVYRFNLAQAAALDVRLTPTGFFPYVVVKDVDNDEFLFSAGQTVAEARRTWLMPSGLTEIRVGAAAAGQTGAYSFSASQTSASVENCQSVIVGGSIQTNQTLTNTDCNISNFFTDQFVVYSSRPCVVTMSRVATGGGMEDPFLEAFDGTTRVAFDDDGAGDVNARISLSSCRSAGDGVLVFHASSFDVGDTGAYTISFVFGAPVVSDAALGFAAINPAKGTRALSGFVDAPRSGTWLDHIGVGAHGIATRH